MLAWSHPLHYARLHQPSLQYARACAKSSVMWNPKSMYTRRGQGGMQCSVQQAKQLLNKTYKTKYSSRTVATPGAPDLFVPIFLCCPLLSIKFNTIDWTMCSLQYTMQV